MAFDVRILFTGLCTFVPNRPFEEKPTTAYVLLPDLRHTTIVGNNPPIAPHFPFVVFDAEDVAPGSRKPDLTFTDDGTERGLCNAVAHELRLRPDGNNRDEAEDLEVVVNQVTDSTQREPMIRAEREDLRWVLRGADAGAGLLRNDLLEGPLTDGITTRIKLASGRLYTAALQRNQPDVEFVRWRLDPDPKRRGFRAVATHVALDVRGVEKEFRLVFDNGNRTEDLVLRPPSSVLSQAEPNKTVEIRIENSELERIVGLGDELFIGENEVDLDEDFAVYSRLAAINREATVLRRDTAGRSPGGKACAPCALDGVAAGGS